MLANITYLLALLIGPLASSYIYLDIPPPSATQQLNNISVQTLRSSLGDSAGFDAAAGWISSSAVYDVAPPPFIKLLVGAGWTCRKIVRTCSLFPSEGLLTVYVPN
jgi:hypothetical protein